MPIDHHRSRRVAQQWRQRSGIGAEDHGDGMSRDLDGPRDRGVKKRAAMKPDQLFG